MMRTIFLKAPTSISARVLTLEPPSASKSQPAPNDNPPARQHVSFAHLTGYDSDESSEEDDTGSESEDRPVNVNKWLPIAPPLKRQKLAVSYREQRKQCRKQRVEEYRKALTDVNKLLLSKRPYLWQGHKVCKCIAHVQLQAISKWLSKMVGNGKEHPNAQQKRMDLQ